MKRRGAAHAQSSISLLLVGSFVLTIASFVAATVLAEQRSRGIEAAAQSLTTNALPSISCLSSSRTKLRKIALLLERLTAIDGSAPRRTSDTERAVLRRAQARFADTWSRCLAAPEYTGERVIEESIDARVTDMNASIDAVLAAVDHGRWSDASAEVSNRTEPLLDDIDAAIVEDIELNARVSTDLGREITRMRSSSTRLHTFLITLSVLLGAVVTFLMTRVLRRFTKVMESRVSEMEHFAGRVAHDIRSPLTTVGLVLELVQRDPERTVARGMLERASATLQRIGQLVDGLLVFARSGEVPEENVSTNAFQIVTAVIEEMRSSAEPAGIALELEEAPERDTIVACSSGVLISLVSNLVGNAIKHMGRSPVRRVSVRVRDLGERLRFEIADSGPGVPPPLRARIFDPYVRAAESTVPGIGLGLATVRRLAEAHGGAVGLLATDGPGSVFWFELPKGHAVHQEARWTVLALFRRAPEGAASR